MHKHCAVAGSKRLSPEPAFELCCEVAIRPGFCWNSHGDTWQPGGVWSQFETGLKSCQNDAYMCTNFLGHPDAVFAGTCMSYCRVHGISIMMVTMPRLHLGSVSICIAGQTNSCHIMLLGMVVQTCVL